METMTAQQAAQRWGISDRRVRVLCGEGKIPGATKDGKSYKIPADAAKPADGREKKAPAAPLWAITLRCIANCRDYTGNPPERPAVGCS
jgi:excisionase family DNA binding protein